MGRAGTLLWACRVLLLILFGFVCWQEDRLGEAQHEPLGTGQTWHEVKYGFYHGIEDRFHVSLLLMACAIGLGAISVARGLRHGCAIDVAVFFVGGFSAADAIMTMALGFT